MYKINDYRKVDGKKNMVGFADVYDTEKEWLIRGCAIFKDGNRAWVNMPSQTYKNEQGETKYASMVMMQRSTQDKFSSQVIEALKVYDPKAPKPFVLKKEEPKEEQFELPF